MINNTENKIVHQLPETAEELYQEAPCGYISFRKNGSIFKINRTLEAWLGFPEKELLLDKKIQDLFTIGGQIYFETHFFPLLRIQGFIREINLDLVRKDGSSFPALINVDERKGTAGFPDTYRATVFDITDRKKYEKELVDAKKKAETASKVKAEYLATISHEIRTPLNAILGISNILKETHLDEEQREFTRILQLSSENLLDLVNNLLDMSKIEARKITLEENPFLLSELVTDLVQLLKIRAEQKNIDLEFNIDKNVPDHLVGDPLKLKQVLTNLLGNAIKFTDSGSVKLEIALMDQKEGEASIHFKVKDTGIGIPEDKLKTVFEEFSQASYDVNQKYGGTGLGLTISQKLLQLHGSELQVQSEEGKGSEFYFEVRYKTEADSQTAFTEKISRIDKELLEASKTLVVDDNEVNVYILTEFLKRWGLDLDTATNGIEALKAINKKQYDLIFMDLHMPEMDGYESAKAIRKLDLSRQPAIIALSASGQSTVDEKLKNAGFNDYLPKPFEPAIMLETIKKHLKNRAEE